MGEWSVLSYTREEINAAGKAIASGTAVDPDYAFEVIDNWRASHNFPLNTFQVTLRRRAKLVDDRSFVAQRIKRLPSIIYKLQHEPLMKLSQMQDIGGCRAIMPNLEKVYELVKMYQNMPLRGCASKAPRDYIQSPPATGYRSIHIVSSYTNPEKPDYNALKIEIQIRSALQHAWATAVETIGTFENEPIKSGDGNPDWLRFFALISSAIARREGTALVPGTPEDHEQLKAELRGLEKKLKVIYKLNGYRESIGVIREQLKDAHWLLLRLDTNVRKVFITGYRKRQLKKAEEAYMEQGRDLLSATNKDVVMVSVDSLNALERAYPNYFADSAAFVKLLSEELDYAKK